jgi:cysteine synthase B
LHDQQLTKGGCDPANDKYSFWRTVNRPFLMPAGRIIQKIDQRGVEPKSRHQSCSTEVKLMTAMVQEMRSKPIMTNPTAPVLEGMGLLEAIGNTPLLPLRRVTRDISPGVKIYAKAEWFNPGGSVKDRPAFNIIRRAVFEGKLHPGMRLLDSTSGNMGIAYATFGAALDIHITLAMPSNASPERTAILRALGAELVLTDAMEGSDGAIHVARQMAGDRPDLYFYANQYDNPANWQAHYNTTGPEIVDQTRGAVTHFVAGLGTSGTLMGVSKYLREYNPGIEIVAVQPDSPFHGLEGLKYMPTAIQPGIFIPSTPDRTIEIPTERAYEMVSCLAREEGYFVGISSGAAAVAALEVASELDTGIIVTVFPDAGYKYLSDAALWKESNCK